MAENKRGKDHAADVGGLDGLKLLNQNFLLYPKVFLKKSDTISIKRVMQVKNYRLSTEAIQKKGDLL